MAERLLIIDDDERLAAMLATFLGTHGYQVEHRGDAASGMQRAERGDIDAVVLDGMLPDIDGLEVCRRLRAVSDVPILMLTARGEETDRIVGLELGADDYLGKPFNPRELLARLRAVMRRRQGRVGGGRSPLRFGRLEIDVEAREARVDGKRCELTGHQFEILRVLAERAGRVQTREQIMEAVRGEDLEAFDRSIDVHVSRIRAAVEEDPRRPRHIKTVRSVGYLFTTGER